MIDSSLGFIVLVVLFDYFNVLELVRTEQPIPTHINIKLVVGVLLMFFVLHGLLLYRYGQTLGKRFMGLAIVTMDGRRPSFAHLILNRYLPQWVAGFMPGGLGALLGILDILFIFRDDKRCVHDLIAGTKVIDLRIKTQSTSSSLIV